MPANTISSIKSWAIREASASLIKISSESSGISSRFGIIWFSVVLISVSSSAAKVLIGNAVTNSSKEINRAIAFFISKSHLLVTSVNKLSRDKRCYTSRV